MGSSIIYLKGYRLEFPTHDVFLCLKIVFISANSADHDEMQHFATFHLGLHCLSKYQLMTSKYSKGYQMNSQDRPTAVKLKFAKTMIKANMVFLNITM